MLDIACIFPADDAGINAGVDTIRFSPSFSLLYRGPPDFREAA